MSIILKEKKMIDLKLTEKEEKVYKLLLKGLSAPIIADKLDYTRDYTNYCKKRIYLKKGVVSQVELLALRIAELEEI